MKTDDKLVLVGAVLSAHGIKGEVILKSFTDPLTNLFNFILCDEKQNPVNIKLVSERSNKLICRIAGVANRNDAEAIRGTKLYCPRSAFPQLPEDEFYVEDLKGMKIVDESLNQLGFIKNVMNFGAGDIIEVEFDDKTKDSELYPFTKLFFPCISERYIILKKDI